MKAVIVLIPCSIAIFISIFIISSAAKNQKSGINLNELSNNAKLEDENYLYPEVDEWSGDFVDEDGSGFGRDFSIDNEDYHYSDSILVDTSSSPYPTSTKTTSTTTSYTSSNSIPDMASLKDTVVVNHKHRQPWSLYRILNVVSIVVLSIR